MDYAHLTFEHYLPRKRNSNTVAIFCHGFPGNFTKNEDIAFELSTKADMEAYVFRYKGVGARRGNFSFTGVINDIGQFVRNLPEDRDIVLVAHSWGATASLKTVVEQPKRFSKLVYLAPMLIWPDRDLISGIVTEAVRLQSRLEGCDPKVEELLAEAETLEQAQALRLRMLSELELPTSIYHGTQDEILPVELSRDIHKSLKNSQLIEFDEGHYFENRLRIRDRVITDIVNSFL